MAAPKIPYPPSPTDVPEDLTDYPASYKSKQKLLLVGLFIFLLFYFGLIALCVLLGGYCALRSRMCGRERNRRWPVNPSRSLKRQIESSP